MPESTVSVSCPLEDANTLVVKGWGDTRIKICKFVYTWTIHNFMLWFEGTSEALISPTFPVGTNDGLKWQLRFQSSGETRESMLHFPIHLTLASCSNKSWVHAKYQFCILSEDQNKFQTKEGFNRISKGMYSGVECFIDQETLLDKKNKLLPDDKLTIYCEITTLSDHLMDYTTTTTPECSLSVDLGVALATQEFSDVILSVNNLSFRAHKVILSARSPVFRAMFNYEKTGSTTNEVIITDMLTEVLEEMLNYIYTGQVPEFETPLAIGLLAAADKYKLKNLKITCEKQISNNLSAENATEIYIFADLHDAKQLKTRAKEFIISHAKDVIITNEWKAMAKDHPKLYDEVFCALVTQQMPFC